MLKMLLKRKVSRKQVLNTVRTLSKEVEIVEADNTLAVVHPSGVKGEITFSSEEMDRKVLDRAKALVRAVKTLGEKLRKVKEVDESTKVVFGMKHEMRFNRGYIASFPYLNAVRGKDYEVFIGKDGEVEVYGDTEKASRIVKIIRR